MKHLSDRVAVMYAGRIVEVGSAEAVYADPRHPYTRELVRVTHAERIAEGRLSDASIDDGPAATGCAYRGACPLREPRCAEERPQLRPTSSGALVACHVTAPAVEEIRN